MIGAISCRLPTASAVFSRIIRRDASSGTHSALCAPVLRFVCTVTAPGIHSRTSATTLSQPETITPGTPCSAAIAASTPISPTSRPFSHIP